MKLTELKRGQIGIITKIPYSSIYSVLIERGFWVGQKITFEQSDIFGDLRIFNIGSKFMLRKEESDLIEIELIN